MDLILRTVSSSGGVLIHVSLGVLALFVFALLVLPLMAARTLTSTGRELVGVSSKVVRGTVRASTKMLKLSGNAVSKMRKITLSTVNTLGELGYDVVKFIISTTRAMYKACGISIKFTVNSVRELNNRVIEAGEFLISNISKTARFAGSVVKGLLFAVVDIIDLTREGLTKFIKNVLFPAIKGLTGAMYKVARKAIDAMTSWLPRYIRYIKTFLAGTSSMLGGPQIKIAIIVSFLGLFSKLLGKGVKFFKDAIVGPSGFMSIFNGGIGDIFNRVVNFILAAGGKLCNLVLDGVGAGFNYLGSVVGVDLDLCAEEFVSVFLAISTFTLVCGKKEAPYIPIDDYGICLWNKISSIKIFPGFSTTLSLETLLNIAGVEPAGGLSEPSLHLSFPSYTIGDLVDGGIDIIKQLIDEMIKFGRAFSRGVEGVFAGENPSPLMIVFAILKDIGKKATSKAFTIYLDLYRNALNLVCYAINYLSYPCGISFDGIKPEIDWCSVADLDCTGFLLDVQKYIEALLLPIFNEVVDGAFGILTGGFEYPLVSDPKPPVNLPLTFNSSSTAEIDLSSQVIGKVVTATTGSKRLFMDRNLGYYGVMNIRGITPGDSNDLEKQVEIENTATPENLNPRYTPVYAPFFLEYNGLPDIGGSTTRNIEVYYSPNVDKLLLVPAVPVFDANEAGIQTRYTVSVDGTHVFLAYDKLPPTPAGQDPYFTDWERYVYYLDTGALKRTNTVVNSQNPDQFDRTMVDVPGTYGTSLDANRRRLGFTVTRNSTESFTYNITFIRTVFYEVVSVKKYYLDGENFEDNGTGGKKFSIALNKYIERGETVSKPATQLSNVTGFSLSSYTGAPTASVTVMDSWGLGTRYISYIPPLNDPLGDTEELFVRRGGYLLVIRVEKRDSAPVIDDANNRRDITPVLENDTEIKLTAKDPVSSALIGSKFLEGDIFDYNPFSGEFSMVLRGVFTPDPTPGVDNLYATTDVYSSWNIEK